MKQIQNSLNYSRNPSSYESYTLPSLTVPNQSMTMREIHSRFVRGLPITGGRTPLFEDPEIESNGRPIESYDLTELQEIAEEAKQTITEEKERQKKRSQQEYNDKYTRDLNAAVEQRLKESKQANAGASEA